jgi:hypothetical protein
VPVGEHWDRSLVNLAGEAVGRALQDAGLDRTDTLIMSNMLASARETPQLSLGAQVNDGCGLRGLPAYKVEAARGSRATILTHRLRRHGSNGPSPGPTALTRPAPPRGRLTRPNACASIRR